MQYETSNLFYTTILQCKQMVRVRMGIYLTPWHISATKEQWHRISLYPTLWHSNATKGRDYPVRSVFLLHHNA